MDSLLLAVLLALGAFVLKTREERRRIRLLALHLSPFQVEKLMEQLIQGYLRALGEPDPARQQQVWQLLEVTEQQLADQVGRLAQSLAQAPAEHTRIHRWALPLVERWWPQSTFDLRELMAVHAQGLRAVVAGTGSVAPKDKAYTLLAELLLFQHSCHWFCKSKTVASARLLARHQTRYEQVLRSVSPATRQAYLAISGQRAPA